MTDHPPPPEAPNLCARCQSVLPAASREGASFCAVCSAAEPRPGTRTMLLGAPAAGAPAHPFSPPAPAPEAAAPPPAAAAPLGLPALPKGTMMGIMPEARAVPLPAAVPAAADAHGLSEERPGAKQTILGLAVPGVVPLHAGRTPEARASREDGAGADAAPIAAQARGRRVGSATVPMAVPFVPAPDPLPELPAPPPPVLVRTAAGVPMATLTKGAAVTGGLVLAAGLAVAFFWRGAPPITAQPRTTADGKDVLHLACAPASCKDGTVVSIDGAKATFAHGHADLTLGSPLHVGKNALSLAVDRPGVGRGETVKLSVSIAYRVHVDVTTMTSTSPCITVHVEAQPDARVMVAGQPVTLDARGTGAYVADESAATEGPADQSTVVSLDVPYAITSGAKPSESGTVSARVPVAPLRVDAPGEHITIDEDHVLVAGRAAKGARVTVNRGGAPVNTDGSFVTTLPVSTLGDHRIEVRSGTATLMPRTIHLIVTRVAHLEDAAQSFEGRHPLGYDAMARDSAGHAGQPVVVDGDVVEARGLGHRTIVLADDRRGCARGPCLSRLVVGRDVTLARGQRVRAYGWVARPFLSPGVGKTPGPTVPEVDVDFLLIGRAKP